MTFAIAIALFAVSAVLPRDRLEMADRLFNRGKYAEARAEYEALAGEASLAADELLYRLAESARMAGDAKAASAAFGRLVREFPASKHADRSRLMLATALPSGDQERRRLLSALDCDRTDKALRAAALYHLGCDLSDPALLERAVAADPKGRYADYASLRLATLVSRSADAAERRRGVGILLGIAFGGNAELAEEALYLAGYQSYRDARYSEASSLIKRYLRTYGEGRCRADAQRMLAWCEYLSGRYSDAAAAAAGREGDDYAYIRAAAAYRLGEREEALKLYRKYLADYPSGRYRADAELPLSRIEFETAEKAGDWKMALESALRSAKLSGSAFDRLRAAWAMEKLGRQNEAAAEYLNLAKEFPRSAEGAEALFRKAMIDAKNDRWGAVDMALAEALASGKCGRFRAEALYWRGMAALKLGHGEEGAKLLGEAEAAGLGLELSREARLAAATVDLNAGRTEAAKAAFARLVKEGAAERMAASQIFAVGGLVGGDEGLICARYLAGGKSPEWRQAGYRLMGSIEEERKSYAAAIDAYRRCLAEDVRTAEAALAALRLGVLESRSAEYARAEATLKEAVKLNASDRARRAEAYAALAANALAQGDRRSARAYATVVVTLFEGSAACAEAERVLKAAGEEGDR